MERLTKRIGENVYFTQRKYESTLSAEWETQDVRNILHRLAAYEDTGLEPETVSKIRDIVLDISGNLARLRELAQADRDGRCVVLPCKAGDTVYFITGIYNNLVKPAKVEEIYVGDGSIDLGVSTAFTAFTLQESEWYLTREEAEAALKEREKE